jgi:hypothetical protein
LSALKILHKALSLKPLQLFLLLVVVLFKYNFSLSHTPHQEACCTLVLIKYNKATWNCESNEKAKVKFAIFATVASKVFSELALLSQKFCLTNLATKFHEVIKKFIVLKFTHYFDGFDVGNLKSLTLRR